MPAEAIRRRLPSAAAALVVLAFFFFFTARSAGRYFDNDDMMNLYFAWTKPLWQVYRPVGALFYRGMFALAAFQPIPFRLACLAIGAGNVALCWRFAALVSGSGRVAALACLLFAFQSRLMEVWFRTAVVYDLLCFTFFYAAVCLYIAARKKASMPGVGGSFAILLCFACALGSKEVAVALPVVLAGYEICFHRLKWAAAWRIAILAAIDVPYLYLKTHGAGALASIPDYQSEFSLARFSGTWALYLKYLFILNIDVAPWMALSVLGAMLAIAAALGWRQLLFAWIVLFAGTLPVAFLAFRGGYVLYVAYAGWVLYGAVLLTGMQAGLTRAVPQYRAALFWAVFAAMGWWWGKRNLHDQRHDTRTWLWESPAQVRALADQMRVLAPHLPRGARVLLRDDAFGAGEWTPYFEMKLLYGDDSMTVDRLKQMDGKAVDERKYGWVFDYADGRYRLVK